MRGIFGVDGGFWVKNRKTINDGLVEKDGGGAVRPPRVRMGKSAAVSSSILV